ncbi:unnamed protein product [Lymnaea stagnalis]|uniref:Ankyrin repeat protein n=1 Tax=Lymnaea stagnalis TaxID=6523 RepID=A0AAV2H416_LYMST
MLRENKANTKMTNKNVMTSLMYRHMNIIQILIEHGADWKNKTRDGMTTLILASESGLTDIVEMLIIYGAKINEKNEFGLSHLLYALQSK